MPVVNKNYPLIHYYNNEIFGCKNPVIYPKPVSPDPSLHLNGRRMRKALEWRRKVVQLSINTHFNRLQQLYFETMSSRVHLSSNRKAIQKIRKTCDGSSMDKPYANLIRDVEAFLNDPSIELTASERGSFEKKLQLLKRSYPLATAFEVAHFTMLPHRRRQYQREWAQAVAASVETLKVGESLVIPWSYNTVKSAHAIQMEIVKIQGDQVLLKVYNTGGSEGTVRPQFYKGKVDVSFFEGLWNHRGAPQKDIRGATLQSRPFQNYLRFKLKAQTPRGKPYHLQGRVGNCTMKSLQVWFHEGIPSQSYRKFRIHRIQQYRQALQKHKPPKWLQTQTSFQLSDLFYTTSQCPVWKFTLFLARSYLRFLEIFVRVSIPKSEVQELDALAAKLQAKRIDKYDKNCLKGS